jgi:hypothetical protein
MFLPLMNLIWFDNKLILKPSFKKISKNLLNIPKQDDKALIPYVVVVTFLWY